MPQTHCSSLFSPSPATDFSLLHDIMRSHIHRGNRFAVLTALTLGVVHEDPAFWRTCTYRDGIAAALISAMMGNLGEAQLGEETRLTSGGASSTPKQEPLTAGELYMILRRISGGDPLLSRVLDQLEEDEPVLCNGNTREEASLCPSSVPGKIHLDDVHAVLQERCCSREEVRQVRPLDTLTAQDNTNTCYALKHLRDYNNSLHRRVRLAAEPTAAVQTNGSCSEDDGGEADETDVADAMKVLSRMPPLPGSTRSMSSFDAVGDFLNYDEGEQAEEVRQNAASSKVSKAGFTCGVTTPGSRQKQRQQRHKFTAEEDEAILQGVARFARGPGRFDSIFYAYRHVWHPGRTATHLHDHWRGTLRQRAVLQHGGYRGKESLATRGKGNAVHDDGYLETDE